MTNTPNKGYPLQVTGTNVGIWGTVVNSGGFSVLDNNLGGTLPINVGGNSNINLTSAQAQYLIHDLTGVLTGNIQYIFPALGGFYTINNGTTGAFTVTVAVVGGGSTVIIPQGTSVNISIDAAGLNVLTQTTAAAPAAAGTLTGATLASNVVNSSLTGVGAIATGVWQGTSVGIPYGGTGANTLPAHNLIVGNGTSTLNFIAPGTSGNVLTSNGTDWQSSTPSSSGVTTTGSPANGNLTKFSGSGTITNADLTGDITTSSGVATTLATVNSNIGSFTNANITVNAKGLITAASNGGVPLITPFAVGSIILAINTNVTGVSVGATTAASNLNVVAGSITSPAFVNSSDSISGTWKALQTITIGSTPGDIGLWQRTV